MTDPESSSPHGDFRFRILRDGRFILHLRHEGDRVDGSVCWAVVVDQNDETPLARIYDVRCTHCYLNHSHSVARHDANIGKHS